jgi:hypothetical protein
MPRSPPNGELKKRRRPVYIESRIRRTRLGDLAWDATKPPNDGEPEEDPRRMPSALDMSTSKVQSRFENMAALADLTSPHSTVASRKFNPSPSTAALRRRFSEDSTEAGEDQPQMQADPEEETEIEFDVTEDKRSEDRSLWDDGSIWELEEVDSDDALLGIIKSPNGRKLSRDVKPLEPETSSQEKPTDVWEQDETIKQRVKSPDSLRTTPMDSFPKTHKTIALSKSAIRGEYGFPHLMEQGRCGRYTKFDESKLREIVQLESAENPKAGYPRTITTRVPIEMSSIPEAVVVTVPSDESNQLKTRITIGTNNNRQFQESKEPLKTSNKTAMSSSQLQESKEPNTSRKMWQDLSKESSLCLTIPAMQSLKAKTPKASEILMQKESLKESERLRKKEPYQSTERTFEMGDAKLVERSPKKDTTVHRQIKPTAKRLEAREIKAPQESDVTALVAERLKASRPRSVETKSRAIPSPREDADAKEDPFLSPVYGSSTGRIHWTPVARDTKNDILDTPTQSKGVISLRKAVQSSKGVVSIHQRQAKKETENDTKKSRPIVDIVKVTSSSTRPRIQTDVTSPRLIEIPLKDSPLSRTRRLRSKAAARPNARLDSVSTPVVNREISSQDKRKKQMAQSVVVSPPNRKELVLLPSSREEFRYRQSSEGSSTNSLKSALRKGPRKARPVLSPKNARFFSARCGKTEQPRRVMFADDVKTGSPDDDDDDDDDEDWGADENWLPDDFVSKYAFRSFAPCVKVSAGSGANYSDPVQVPVPADVCNKPKDIASMLFEDSQTKEEDYSPREGSRNVLYDQPIPPLAQVRSPDVMVHDGKGVAYERSNAKADDNLKTDSQAPSSPTSRKRFKRFRRQKTIHTAAESKDSNPTTTKGQKSVYKGLDGEKEVKRYRFKMFGRKGKVSKDKDSSNDKKVEKIQTEAQAKKPVSEATKATGRRTESKSSVYNFEQLDASGGVATSEAAGCGENDPSEPTKKKSRFFKRGLFNRRVKKQSDAGTGEKSKANLYVRRRREFLPQKDDDTKYQKIGGESKVNQKEQVKKGRQVYAKLAFPKPVLVVSAEPAPKAVEVESWEADPLSPAASTDLSMPEEKSPQQAGIIESSTSSESEATRMLRVEKALSRQMMEDLLLLANLEKERRRLARRGVADEDMHNNLGEKASDAVARVESVIEKSRRNRSNRRQATQPKKSCYEEATRALRDVLGCPVPYKRVD